MKPYYQRENVTLYNGECLAVLNSMEDGTIDALITDPPYSSGGQFRSDRSQSTVTKYVQTDSENTCRVDFSGDNRDQRAFFLWCNLWLGECLRKSTPGAIAVIATDWRQLPIMTDALQVGGWVWRNIVTWWKPGCRMQRGRFSSSAEYFVYGSHGVPCEGEDSPQNVISVPLISGDDKVHIAEKPVPLMAKIVGVTPRGSVVFDPFMGSGTTGVACVARCAARPREAIEKIKDLYLISFSDIRRMLKRILEIAKDALEATE